MSYLINPFRFGGGGGLPAATRWRCMLHGTNEGYNSRIAELEMAAAPSGTNLCVGGSVLSWGTGAGGGLVPGNAFDGNPATYWQLNLGVGQGLGYVFPAPVSVGVMRITAESATANVMWQAVVPEYSLDGGTTWISCEPVLLPTYAVGATVEFAVVPMVGTNRATARFWRKQYTSGNARTQEIEFRQGMSGSNLCVGGMAWGQGAVNSSVRPQLAFEGRGGMWQGGTSGATYAQYLFATPPNPDYAAVQAASSSPNSMGQDWTFDWSLNGRDWNTVRTVTGETGWSNNQWRTYSLP